MINPLFATLSIFWMCAVCVSAQPFALPTPNRDILDPVAYTNYFVPTVGNTWESGTFGCVRSQGTQLHEGLDIRSKTFTKSGEAADPVLCTADGVVVYTSAKPAQSSYGRYVVVKHKIDGIDIYSLYAHLASIDPQIKTGTVVKTGTKLGIVGRSANTKDGISKARSHLHFELCLYLNSNFIPWFKKNYKSDNIHHNGFMGWNLAGLDPWLIFKTEWKEKSNFNLVNFIRNREVLCRVLIHKKEFPFADIYPVLVNKTPSLKPADIAAWEVSFDQNGVPIAMTPRSAAEVGKAKARYLLLSVNAKEQAKNPGRKFLTKTGGKWKMTNKFITYLDQITFTQ